MIQFNKNNFPLNEGASPESVSQTEETQPTTVGPQQFPASASVPSPSSSVQKLRIGPQQSPPSASPSHSSSFENNASPTSIGSEEIQQVSSEGTQSKWNPGE